MSGHQDRAHAFLGASSAKQWLACTPSIKASAHKPNTTSTFALEGTFAHELSELCFALKFEGMHSRTFNVRLKKMKQNEYYSEELEEYVAEYVDYVTERVNAAKARDEESLVLMFETRLDLSTYVPHSFGTGDVIVYSDGELEIIDLKYGKGVAVSAQNNPQLRLYGLGAAELLEMIGYEVEKVTMTIHQPRLDSISSETLDLDQLKGWGELYVKPRAEKAYKGEGEYVPGEHCRFCKIKAECRARAEANLKEAEAMQDPNLLTDEEIADLLFKVGDIEKWAKDVKSFAQFQALEGKTYEGWKLVAGKSNRKITDTQEALETLTVIYDESEVTKPKELLPITKLEKAVGKKELTDLIGHLIVKPEGAPTLVEESDKRPALNSAESEFEKLN